MEKIKLFGQSDRGKDIIALLIIVLVGIGSFGLGRLSTAQNEAQGVQITQAALPIVEVEARAANVLGVTSSITSTEPNTTAPRMIKSAPRAKSFFASSRGSKYYHLGCSGGKTLKEENKIWFASKEEAELAGYELSTSCK